MNKVVSRVHEISGYALGADTLEEFFTNIRDSIPQEILDNATHFDVEHVCEYGDDYARLMVRYNHTETDRERKYREKEEARYATQRKRLYATLKKEFEGKE